MALTVELQPRDGGWIQLGTQQDGGYGILPGSIEFDGDLSEYGCLGASFWLHANPRWPIGIVEQFTPMVISGPGGQPVWSGRIIAAPTTFAEDAKVVVQGQGWGQHAKDDCMDKVWVVRDLSRWRSSLESGAGVNPAQFNHGTSIDSSGGAITFRSGAGVKWWNGRMIGCLTLDLGPDNFAKRILVNWAGSANFGASDELACQANNSMDPFSSTARSFAFQIANPGAGAVSAGTFGNGYRYVHLYLYRASGDLVTTGDAWLQFRDILVFTDAADESGNASVLTPSTIITETIDALCPLWSTDRSRIATNSFYVPHFPDQQEWLYAHELLNKANAFVGQLLRVSPDPVAVPEFAPLPTAPSYVVGAGEYTLSDPANQDGREVFSRVVSPYETPSGVPARVEVGGSLVPAVSMSIPNPSFAANTTGWAAVGVNGQITRSTAQYSTAPASLLVEDIGVGATGASVTMTGGTGLLGTVEERREYTLRFRAMSLANATMRFNAVMTVGSNQVSGDQVVIGMSAGVWIDVVVRVIAPATGTASIILRQVGVTSWYLDDVEILWRPNTVVGKRGFQRTLLKPASGPSNAAVATQFAQLELDAHQAPPFKGTIVVTGRVRTMGGGSIHCRDLPARVGDAILIENIADPLTGALGRQGIIQTAKYNEAMDACEIVIDDPRSFVDQLRAQYAVNLRR